MPLWNLLLNGWILWLNKGSSRYLSNVLPDSRPNPISLSPYTTSYLHSPIGFPHGFLISAPMSLLEQGSSGLVWKVLVSLVLINHVDCCWTVLCVWQTKKYLNESIKVRPVINMKEAHPSYLCMQNHRGIAQWLRWTKVVS